MKSRHSFNDSRDVTTVNLVEKVQEKESNKPKPSSCKATTAQRKKNQSTLANSGTRIQQEKMARHSNATNADQKTI